MNGKAPTGTWVPDARRTEQQRRGVPNERTSLAWTRSAMALGVVAALMIRAGAMNQQYAIAFPAAAIVLVAAVGAWRYGTMRYRARHVDSGGYVASPAALRTITAATACAAAIAIVVVLSG